MKERDDSIVRLNRAVALAEVQGVAAGLAEIEALAAQSFDDFLPYHAVRADLLRRAGRRDEARLAYDAALALVDHFGRAAVAGTAKGSADGVDFAAAMASRREILTLLGALGLPLSTMTDLLRCLERQVLLQAGACAHDHGRPGALAAW